MKRAFRSYLVLVVPAVVLLSIRSVAAAPVMGALPNASAATRSPFELLRLTGGSPCDQFGFSLSGAGDANGDGYEDFIVGAPFVRYAGRAYVYLGGPRSDSLADLTLHWGRQHFRFRPQGIIGW